jgi:hypothetical protein
MLNFVYFRWSLSKFATRTTGVGNCPNRFEKNTSDFPGSNSFCEFPFEDSVDELNFNEFFN